MTTPLLNAQTVPYKASGTNAQFNPYAGPGMGVYTGTGQGTHLGKHKIDGDIYYAEDFVLNFAAGPGEVFASGNFTGRQTVTAANGDKLNSTITGSVELTVGDDLLVSGTWYPTFELEGGTGRFSNSSGTVGGAAINPPFGRFDPIWPFDWFVDGKFNLGQKTK